MKTFLLLALLTVIAIPSMGQTPNPNYDPELAEAMGADDYGMKNYIFVILKTGSGIVEDKAVRDSLFAGHLANIRRLVDLGKMVLAGPLGRNDNSYRGLFILNVPTFDEALELLHTDPAIAAELLEPDLYQWYGSAALPEYIKASEKINKYMF